MQRGIDSGGRVARRRRQGRTIAACLLAAVLALGLALVPAAQASTAIQITLAAISPPTIVGDGVSTATATANVTDGSGNGVAGDSVTFSSSDTSEKFSATSDQGNGNYTATITSSTALGTAEITATDNSTPLALTSNQQPLQQTAGSAANISLGQLSPSSIPADGSSTSQVTATVTDAAGHPLAGEPVKFSSTDLGDKFSSKDNGDGTYTATITASTNPGKPTITASDGGLTSNSQTLTQTPLPATSVALAPLQPSSIHADGSSQSIATATVTDKLVQGVAGQIVAFSSTDSHESISGTKYHGNGVYSATITSSTSLGSATITAHDGALASNGQALAQTIGPPSNISLSVNPPTLLANGSAQSIATATVTDSALHGVSGERVTITGPPGENISPVTDQGNGNYTATITSTTLGQFTIIANDVAAGLSTRQSLKQVALTSTTTLVISPASPPQTNQGVTLIATINPQLGAFAAGTMDFFAGFSPLPGCTGLPVSSSTPIAACPASFAAASSPVPLLAVFTPSLVSNVAGSSATASLTVVKGSTTTSVSPSSFTPTVGGRETFTATVLPTQSGAAAPTGSVEFEQGGTPIGSCRSVALSLGGTASCTVKYRIPGTHRITAVYSGNVNFNGSTSGSQTITVGAHGQVTSFVQWLFSYHPRYTTVASLQVSGVAVGANVLVTCKGRGCPYTKRMTTLHRGFRCTRSGRHKCGSPGPVNLGTTFRRHHLAVGTTIIVEIRRPGFVGKFYRFTIRAGRGPLVRILCLAPGLNKPGVACTLG